MSSCLKEKLEKINSILSSTDEEILEMLTDKWKEGIKNSSVYKVWDCKGKTDDQCIVEVLRCQLESIKNILQLFMS